MHILKALLLLSHLAISVLSNPEAADDDINAADVERNPFAEMDVDVARRYDKNHDLLVSLHKPLLVISVSII